MPHLRDRRPGRGTWRSALPCIAGALRRSLLGITPVRSGGSRVHSPPPSPRFPPATGSLCRRSTGTRPVHSPLFVMSAEYGSGGVERQAWRVARPWRVPQSPFGPHRSGEGAVRPWTGVRVPNPAPGRSVRSLELGSGTPSPGTVSRRCAHGFVSEALDDREPRVARVSTIRRRALAETEQGTATGLDDPRVPACPAQAGRRRHHRVAERVGFEPTKSFDSALFKSAAINHSATSPRERIPGGPTRGGAVPRGLTVHGARSKGRRAPSLAVDVASESAIPAEQPMVAAFGSLMWTGSPRETVSRPSPRSRRGPRTAAARRARSPSHPVAGTSPGSRRPSGPTPAPIR